MLFTKEEDKVIKKYYGKDNEKLFKILHHRSAKSILDRAKVLTDAEDLINNKKRPPGFSWSKEEEAIIKKYYGNNNKLLFDLLKHRTIATIRRRAWLLDKTRKRNDKNKGHRWTEKEIRILKENYNKNLYNKKHLLSLLPNRTFDSIKLKAVELGLTKKANRQEWTQKEIKILKEFGHFKTKLVVELINTLNENRTYLSITKKIHKLKAKNQILSKEDIAKDKHIELTLEALRILSLRDGFLTMREFKETAEKYDLMLPDSLLYHTKMTWKEIGESLGYKSPSHKEVREQKQEKAINDLQEAAKILGDLFTKKQYTEYQKKNTHLMTAAKIQNNFNRWNEAKQAAGLPTYVGEDVYTDQELINFLNKCQADLNKEKFSELEYSEWKKKQPRKIASMETIRKRLGGSILNAKGMIDMPAYKMHGNITHNKASCETAIFHFIKSSKKIYDKWVQDNELDYPTGNTIVNKLEKNWYTIIDKLTKEFKDGKGD